MLLFEQFSKYTTVECTSWFHKDLCNPQRSNSNCIINYGEGSLTITRVFTKRYACTPASSLSDKLLAVIADFLLAYSHALDPPTFKKLLAASLNSAKSNNPIVRTSATSLFKVLIAKDNGSTDVDGALIDVLALPKTGKTTGPEHRLTLYAMLATIPPSAKVSSTIVQTVPQLLVKETSDAAVGVLASIMAVNLTYMLNANIQVPADTTTVVAKEMSNPKPVIRRAFVSIAGSALWNVDTLDTDAALAFPMGITGALEASLKSVTTNPLTAAVGPLEGYVALALLMGPLAKTLKFGMLHLFGSRCVSCLSHSGDIVMRNTTIEVLTGTQAKPSFLISDKIYKKLTDAEEEIWLLRAINLSLFRMKNELGENEQLR